MALPHARLKLSAPVPNESGGRLEVRCARRATSEARVIDSMGRLTLCVTLAAAFFAATGSAQGPESATRCDQFAGAASQPRSSGGARQLNDRALAQFVVTRDAPPGQVHGFIVVGRGDAHWRGNEVRSSGSETFSPRTRQIRGSLTLSRSATGPRADYDLGPDSSIVRVARTTFSLATGNVILVDRVDEVGGPPTAALGGCIELEPTTTLFERLLQLPQVQTFVGPLYHRNEDL